MEGGEDLQPVELSWLWDSCGSPADSEELTQGLQDYAL